MLPKLRLNLKKYLKDNHWNGHACVVIPNELWDECHKHVCHFNHLLGLSTPANHRSIYFEHGRCTLIAERDVLLTNDS